jgi:hypothetical protein
VLLRRAAAYVSTVVVAIVVALAVPVSQLRTVTILKTCCCPDPSNCHCPDHQVDPSSQPSMRPCHNSEQVLVAPQLPVFSAPAVAAVQAPVAPTLVTEPRIPAPHQAPPPIRPDAPS